MPNSWSYTFRADNEREARRAHDRASERDSQTTEQAGGDRPCSRGEHCASAVRERQEDGKTVRKPMMGFRAFCDADRAIIIDCLRAFPDTYSRLGAALGDHVVGEVTIRVPFGPSVEIRTDVDEIQRAIIDGVMSWRERVAGVARLSMPDTAEWRRKALSAHACGLLPFSVTVLAEHVDALLALEPDVMLRPGLILTLGCGTREVLDDGVRCEARSGSGQRCVRDRHEADRDHEDARGLEWPFTGGTVVASAGGADAGNEIMRLDYLGRAALGETNPLPERLLGVQCPECSRHTLRRAAPPQHDGDPEFFATCTDCRALLTDEEYRQWATRLVRFYSHRITPAVLASAGLRGDETKAIAEATGTAKAA